MKYTSRMKYLSYTKQTKRHLCAYFSTFISNFKMSLTCYLIMVLDNVKLLHLVHICWKVSHISAPILNVIFGLYAS